jgi:indole-3-glycerol phosphate synthase
MSFLKHMSQVVQQRIQDLDALPLRLEDYFPEKEINLIGEIKFASPTLGPIYQGSLSVLEIAQIYLNQGVKAFSILTEPYFFRGNIEYIKQLHYHFPHIPILMKDFILDEKQILQAHRIGASAILLIAAFLPTDRLKALYQFACRLGLSVLVEVHNQTELEAVLPIEPRMIGINNRDLNTMRIDMQTTVKLIKMIPSDVVIISESGIENRDQMHYLQTLGCDGFLVGTSLMKNLPEGL